MKNTEITYKDVVDLYNHLNSLTSAWEMQLKRANGEFHISPESAKAIIEEKVISASKFLEEIKHKTLKMENSKLDSVIEFDMEEGYKIK